MEVSLETNYMGSLLEAPVYGSIVRKEMMGHNASTPRRSLIR